jgi:hypothetical protein
MRGETPCGYELDVVGKLALVETKSNEQQLAMLRILYGACSAALEAFRAADNPVDQQLILDLGTMVARTQDEIERMTARIAGDAG